MWRCTRLCYNSVARNAKMVTQSIKQRTPYQQLLRAMENGNTGLLTAAEIFKQFESYYRHVMRNQETDNGHHDDDNVQSEKAQSHSSTTLSSKANSITNSTNNKLPTSSNTSTTTTLSVLETQRTEENHYHQREETILKPLTEFCVVKEEVEPLTIMLLKVLCDLQRLEEMRFLFTQCILELDRSSSSPPPSCELFNVYLLAISMTDTFNRNEIENVVELMHTRQVIPDVVTKLSVYILYLRLGLDCNPSWWEAIREEVKSLIDNDMTSQYSLLPLRLQHCFQTLMRLHYDVNIIHECFTLLHKLTPERLPPTLLIPYLILSNLNAATPPQTVITIVTLLEEYQRRELELMKQCKEAHNSSLSKASSSAAAPFIRKNTTSTTTNIVNGNNMVNTIESNSVNNLSPTLKSIHNVLHSEVTILRLLSKCAKYKDVNSARWVRSLVQRQESIIASMSNKGNNNNNNHGSLLEHEETEDERCHIITPQHKPIAALLYLETLVQCNELSEAFTVVESELVYPYNKPLERKKVILPNKRTVLLHSDPVSNFIDAMTRFELYCENGVRRRGTAAVLHLLRQLLSNMHTRESIEFDETNHSSNSNIISNEDNTANNITYNKNENSNKSTLGTTKEPINNTETIKSATTSLSLVVTRASYNLLMAAYAREHNYTDAESLLEFMKQSNTENVNPDAETYTYLISAYATYNAAQLALRIRQAFNEMNSTAVEVTGHFINTALKVALSNGDCGTALFVLEKSAELQVIIEPRQSIHVLHELTRLCDFSGVQRAVRCLRASHSPIDRKTLLQCLIYLRSNKVECTSLEALLR